MKYTLAIFVFILGCGVPETEKENNTTIDSVSVEKIVDRQKPEIKKSEHKFPSLKMTGPAEKLPREKERIPATMLMMGPGGVSAIGYLPILEKFSKSEVRINIIGGFGLASVIATYYAFGFSTDEIEWKLYNLFRKSKGIEFFSSRWLVILNEILQEDFGSKEIEQARSILFIPVWNPEVNKIEYKRKGPVVELLVKSLSQNSVRKNCCSSTLNINGLKYWVMPDKMGADLIFGLSIRSKNKYLYQKAMEGYNILINRFGILLPIKLEKFGFLDASAALQVIGTAKNQDQKIVDLVSSKISDWQKQ